MSEPSHDPSVELEPHLHGAFDPGDSLADEPTLTSHGPDRSNQAVDVEHTVWDEPSLLAATTEGVVEAPAGQLTYARWLDQGVARFTSLEAWAVTFLVAVSAGPWGVLGALMTGTGTELGFLGLLSATFIAPVTEEITKIAAALWVVEKRPYWFTSITQILLCAAIGGLAFAFIENLMYLYARNPHGGADYRWWRWVVCTGLHLVCSLTAGVGLARIWHLALKQRRRPELAVGMPWFAAAMIMHGLYNFCVTVAEAGGWLDFD